MPDIILIVVGIIGTFAFFMFAFMAFTITNQHKSGVIFTIFGIICAFVLFVVGWANCQNLPIERSYEAEISQTSGKTKKQFITLDDGTIVDVTKDYGVWFEAQKVKVTVHSKWIGIIYMTDVKRPSYIKLSPIGD